MTSLTDYDVVITGAGPAGSAAAIVLCQHNLRVALLDPLTATGLKVGESLPGAVARLLQRLGVNSLSELLADDEYIPCIANASAWNTPQWSYKDSLANPEGGGWHVDRSRFDAALRERAVAAGAVLLAGQVQKVRPLTSDGYLLDFQTKNSGITTPIQGNWVIDASGRRGVVTRQLGGHYQRIHNQLAAVGWFYCNPEDQEQMTRTKTVTDGWWYTARIPGRKRVAVFHSEAEAIKAIVRDPAVFTNAYQAAELLPFPWESPQLVQKPFACDAGTKRLEQTTGEGWLAVGDATLAFDPLMAQGMFFSLYSGILSGEAITQELQSPGTKTAELMESYSNKVSQIFNMNMNNISQFYGRNNNNG